MLGHVGRMLDVMSDVMSADMSEHMSDMFGGVRTL
jgi:hypothetical protein